MAATARGDGPRGFSFEASFTTSSRPSSRLTSSTGLPGTYGSRRWIWADVLGARTAGPLRSGSRRLDEPPDERRQLRRLERLRHVALRASHGRERDVGQAVERRKHHDRDRRRFYGALQLPEGVEAVHP